MSEKRVRVDIWSDIACPWCFIGKRRFEKGVEEFEFSDNVDVYWHAYQLDPSLPEHYDGDEVQYLSQVKGMDPEQVKGMLEHVTEQAAGEGLNYRFDQLRPANSFTALRVLEQAKTESKGSEMKETLLSAHFERGLDTGDRQVLAKLATEVGLDEAATAETLNSQKYAEEVNADIEQARQLGISGVPFFVIDGKYGISGAQPAEAFTNALAQVHAETAG
ncbi:DsbA family oxidoreductase [Glutamicibacter bergerei]|jgi:predicted DsbA family dithiol-disulfide isomerase|uniref:DsbA family oxidoreductase n=1 Tax=Glutamicibacter ardleyensis TaxID=225894 RepID=UPI003F945DC6